MRKVNLSVALVVTLFLAAPVLAQGFGKLPETRLDSFVKEAKGNAELIYGDEGGAGSGETTSSEGALPPYFGYDQSHRIASGIYSDDLTTGHGSYLPDATGRDEFLGAEWSQSAPQANSNSTPPAVAVFTPRTGLAPARYAVSAALRTRTPSASWDLSSVADSGQ